MKHVRFIAAMLLAVGLGSHVSAQTGSLERPATALVLPIRGEIEPALVAFLRRALNERRDSMPTYVIFEVDTFGGRVDSALQITTLIGNLENTETIAYVRGGPDGTGVSWSAGALISFACDRIAMAPGTSMGAAAPMYAGPDGSMVPAPEKSVSAVRTQMAALAEKNGYPKGIALAMVDMEVELVEVIIGDEVILATAEDMPELERRAAAQGEKLERGRIVSPKGKLLSLTAGEMERYGLSFGSFSRIEDLYAAIGVNPQDVVSLERTSADEIVALVTGAGFTSLLILIGLIALFMELTTPGFGVPGAVAVICFSILFAGNFLLGRVGSMELLLFLMGIVLLMVELFVLPGFGVTGIAGIAAIGAAILFSMQDFLVPTFDWEWDIFQRNLAIVAANVIGALGALLVLAAVSPRIRLFRRFSLQSEFRNEEGWIASGGPTDLIGKRGSAVTTLRPSGKVEIEGAVHVVDADGEFIERGTPVTVARLEGSRIIVRSVRDPALESDGATAKRNPRR